MREFLHRHCVSPYFKEKKNYDIMSKSNKYIIKLGYVFYLKKKKKSKNLLVYVLLKLYFGLM